MYVAIIKTSTPRLGVEVLFGRFIYDMRLPAEE